MRGFEKGHTYPKTSHRSWRLETVNAALVHISRATFINIRRGPKLLFKLLIVDYLNYSFTYQIW